MKSFQDMAIRINKQELASTIRNLQELTDEQKSALLELLHEKKQYGLVWENHEEDVEEQLREQLPVLKEVPEHRILSEDKDAPNHILIEGDKHTGIKKGTREYDVGENITKHQISKAFLDIA